MRRLIPLGLLLAIIAVYANALHGPFIWDDNASIVWDPYIRSLWPCTELLTTSHMGIVGGRPLVAISLALNYAAGGLDPTGYHLFNIAVHVLCALLLYGLVRRTLLLPRWQGLYDSSGPWLAGAAALIWALHPINTEAIDYVTQRSESMMSMFLLLMLYAIVRLAQSTHSTRWVLLAIAASAAGMACKQTMVVAPVVAMLYEFVFLPRRLLGRRTLYAGLMATWLLLLLTLHAQNMDSMNPSDDRVISPLIYLETQTAIIVHYLRLCIWPRGLTVDYRDWQPVSGLRQVIRQTSLLFILLTASVLCCLRRAWPGFLGALFFLILAPSSSVVPLIREMVAERRMYLPSAAVIILLLAAAWQLLQGLPKRSARTTAIFGVVILAIIFAATTAARNRDYQSAIRFWSDAIQKRPHSPMGHYYLSWAYADVGDWKNARVQAELARANNAPPGWLPALFNFISQQRQTIEPPH